MLRPSSYVIRINTHESDRVLLVHGYTKAVDLVPTRIADLLEQPNREITEEDLSEANQKHLLARGHLTELSVDEERKAFVGFVGRLDAAERARKMPGFVLLPTYLCNLDCFYCYQKPALESDADLVKHLMTTELADKAFEAYARMLPAGRSLQGGDLLLYGGEPLLRRSRPLIEYVVKKARANGMTVRAISNGTQLQHYEDLLGPDGIRKLQITLDGPKETHDTRRVSRGGQGSFDSIVENIGLALRRGVQVVCRLNIDKQNLESILSLDEMFRGKGWYDEPNFSAYAAEVHMTEETEEWVNGEDIVSELDLATFVSQHALKIRTGKNHSLEAFNQLQLTSGAASFKTAFCGANYSMCIFDPKGNVYSCWEEVERFEPVGHFHTGTVVYNEQLRRAWQRSPLVANPRCHECAYAFYCGGGCDWHGKKEGDAYYDKYCNAFISNLRGAIAEDYAVSVVAVERKVGSRTQDGRLKLTEQDRAQILKEVGDKLARKNISACQFSCSSQAIKDEGALHQKKTGLIQLKRKSEALAAEAKMQLVGGQAC